MTTSFRSSAPEAIKKRVMSIVTDSTPLGEPKEPETCNVFQLYKLFSTEEEQAELAERYRWSWWTRQAGAPGEVFGLLR